MGRSSKSVSLETHLLNRVEKESEERGGSFSDEVNRALRKTYKSEDSTGLINCDSCGAEYSESLPGCPQCDSED